MKRTGETDPERWARIREIFDALLDADADSRDTLLAARCDHDEVLAMEVRELLEAHEALERSADAASILDESPAMLSTLLRTTELASGDLGADAGRDLVRGGASRDAHAERAEAREADAREDAPPVLPEAPFRWGRLEVLEPIGAGGFGRVFRAHDPSLLRDVALKLRVIDASGRTHGGEDHLEEARRLARIRHPNVLVVHGAEAHDGWAGIWTDLVPGATLDHLLRSRGPFSREALLRTGLDLCRAVEAVHGAGLVHGDIKPSNAMRDEDGRVLLMDFGSGRSAPGPSDDVWEDEPRSAGQQGTPIAMAPELFDGASASVATDLYAIGVLLYRVASGEYPQRGSNLAELRRALKTKEPISLGELRPDLPAGLAAVVHRCLSREAERRPSSAAELHWLLAASLGAEEPEFATADNAPVPRASTRFIGRVEALRDLRHLLAAPGVITLLGPGGCGKTRLAARLGAELHRSLDGGTFWIDLAALPAGGEVASAVAHGAGARSTIASSAEEDLARFFVDRSCLLVLDNAEHVHEAVAELVARLAPSCRRLRVLVTSRQRLQIPDERVYRLAPMDLPERAEGLEIMGADAVRLFLDRVQRGNPEFRLTTLEAPEVARIVRRLDGLPLAIEMAAARVATLGLAVVASKLEESFRLLASRGGVDRHATLMASIRWSHDLLEPREAKLLARLSVFAAGCTVAAAERVCSDPEPSEPSVPDSIVADDMIELLVSLVDRSLVFVETLVGAEPRYRLLESVRAFAGERLAERDEVELLKLRLHAWIASEARIHGPSIHGPEMKVHLAWFEREHANLLATLDWLEVRVRDGADLAEPWARLLMGIRPYWRHSGFLREGRRRFQAFCAADRRDAPSYGNALTCLASMIGELGDNITAIEMGRQATELAREKQQPNVLATTLIVLAELLTWASEVDEARQCYLEAIAIRTAEENPVGLTTALCNLGVLEATAGNLPAALDCYEKALVIARSGQDESSIGHLAANVAITHFELGHAEAAYELALESVGSTRRSGSLPGIMNALRILAFIEVALGRLEDARVHLLEALARVIEDGEVNSAIHVLDATVDLLAAEGRSDRAVEVLGGIEAARETSQITLPIGFRPRWDARRDRLRVELGPEAFAARWAAGRARPFDAMMETALATS